jgi:hypothetical protein
MRYLGSPLTGTVDLATGDLGADIVTGAKIADDQINSEHYVDGSIDTAHIAANQIDGTLTKDALIADYSDVTITASDLIMYGDATDSNNTKRDTVQGILDLASSGPTIGTEIATTSGTSKTFSGIAAGTTRIHLAFEKVGFAGSEVMLIQIGDSGGIETSGYEGGGTKVLGSASHETSALTTCFPIRRSTTADDINGIMTLLHIGSNTWIASHACGGGTAGQNDGYHGGGNKTLSGELTQIQVSGGTFDLGTLNIFTE